jgi:hypothetical protein
LGEFDTVALPLREVNVAERGFGGLELDMEVQVLFLDMVAVDVGALHPC